MKINRQILLSAYEKMCLIRSFESKLLDDFSKGLLSGTTHTYTGQEAIAVAISYWINDADYIFSNHRCHGHYIAIKNDPEGLYNEILGNSTGINKGLGGSQHINNENFYTNGIQGGYMPMAIGVALHKKINKCENIVIAFIGDGTMGEGVVYESLNLASLLSVPIMIVVENNQYAQSTHIRNNLAGKIINRAKAFDIEAEEITSSNFIDLYKSFYKNVNYVRDLKKPFIQIINTYRFNAHSKGDDNRKVEEVDYFKKNFDPLLIIEKNLNQQDIIFIKNNVKERINNLSSIN